MKKRMIRLGLLGLALGLWPLPIASAADRTESLSNAQILETGNSSAAGPRNQLSLSQPSNDPIGSVHLTNRQQTETKQKMKSTHLVAMIIAATLPASALFAQEEHGKMDDMMKGDHAQMAEMHQKMDAEMKTQNAELDKLVATMNSATGEKKVDAIVAVVSKLVEQRRAMQEKMAAMHKKMEDGMMKHDPKKKTESSPSPTAR